MKARNNPFRTQRMETLLTFRPEWIGESWEGILDRWHALGQFVSIVGPKGTGKTTCLESLRLRLCDRDYDVQSVDLQSFRVDALPVVREGAIVLLDSRALRSADSRWAGSTGGASRAAVARHSRDWRAGNDVPSCRHDHWRGRAATGIPGWAFRRALRRELSKAAGLIETRHWRGHRPVLLRTRATPEILARCIRTLDASAPLSKAAIGQLFRRHRGNVRTALLECYDLASDWACLRV